MDGYLNVVQKRMDSLIQITIKERKEKGLGCLFLDFTKKNNMDCSYIDINDSYFPSFLDKYKERMVSLPNSIIFLLIFDENEHKMIEIDLDKNSKYYKDT